MNKFIILLLIALFAGTACRKASAPPAAGSLPPPESTPAEQLNQPIGGLTPPPQTKHFKGSIGSSLDLQMKLVRNGDQLTGSYFYQKVGTPITLRGAVDKEGNLTLEEFDPNGKQTGVFKGLWKVEANDGLITLVGNWSKPPGEKGEEKKTAFSVHEEPISFSGDVDIVAKPIKESNKKLMYEIDVQYPHLTGGNNPNFEKFNQAARAVVMKEVSAFKKDMAPAGEEALPPEGSMGSSLTIAYSIALAQDDLVSVQFDINSYFQGAVHPNSHTGVLNFDLKNAKTFKLGDLFKPGAKYLQTISSYCVAALKKNTGLPDDQIASGAAPAARNYQSWKITRQGLGINFDTNQVGSYADGPQFVLVPYSTLKELINPDGPLVLFAM